jgi:thiamine-phosphate pyrophosphorylase
LKKRRIPNSGLYALIDRSACGPGALSALVGECLKAKVELIQLRDKTQDTAGFYKNALLIRRLTKDKALYIINDRLDIAQAAQADGVHLGQDDLPVKAARAIMGPHRIIGKSCHSLKQAIQAEREGVDYISIGPIFKTPTKPGYRPVGLKVLKETCRRLKLPIVAIGGINMDNIKLVRNAGARLIAVVRAICKAGNAAKAIAQMNYDTIRISPQE